MSEFRRFILSVIGGLEILFVVASTIISGLLGALPSAIWGGGREAALIGFIIAALAGFCFSAIIVNISMSLAEIAANTALALQPGRKGSKKQALDKDLQNETPASTPKSEEDIEAARIFLQSRGIRLSDDT